MKRIMIFCLIGFFVFVVGAQSSFSWACGYQNERGDCSDNRPSLFGKNVIQFKPHHNVVGQTTVTANPSANAASTANSQSSAIGIGIGGQGGQGGAGGNASSSSSATGGSASAVVGDVTTGDSTSSASVGDVTGVAGNVEGGSVNLSINNPRQRTFLEPTVINNLAITPTYQGVTKAGNLAIGVLPPVITRPMAENAKLRHRASAAFNWLPIIGNYCSPFFTAYTIDPIDYVEPIISMPASERVTIHAEMISGSTNVSVAEYLNNLKAKGLRPVRFLKVNTAPGEDMDRMIYTAALEAMDFGYSDMAILSLGAMEAASAQATSKGAGGSLAETGINIAKRADAQTGDGQSWVKPSMAPYGHFAVLGRFVPEPQNVEPITVPAPIPAPVPPRDKIREAFDLVKALPALYFKKDYAELLPGQDATIAQWKDAFPKLNELLGDSPLSVASMGAACPLGSKKKINTRLSYERGEEAAKATGLLGKVVVGGVSECYTVSDSKEAYPKDRRAKLSLVLMDDKGQAHIIAACE